MKYDALGLRMKSYEAETKTYLTPKSYTILRIDGRAFHTFTRGLQRPFDADLTKAMNRTAESLCAELVGAQIAYTQSDEISVLLTDAERSESQAMFGGVIQKLVSVSASIATATFNKHWTKTEKLATFDARIFNIPFNDLNNYFIWRQHDCLKNSVSSAASAHFSHIELLHKNTTEKKDMLKSLNLDWEDLALDLRQGRHTMKETHEEVVTFTHKRTNEINSLTVPRTRWATYPAMLFSQNSVYNYTHAPCLT